VVEEEEEEKKEKRWTDLTQKNIWLYWKALTAGPRNFTKGVRCMISFVGRKIQ